MFILKIEGKSHRYVKADSGIFIQHTHDHSFKGFKKILFLSHLTSLNISFKSVNKVCVEYLTMASQGVNFYIQVVALVTIKKIARQSIYLIYY